MTHQIIVLSAGLKADRLGSMAMMVARPHKWLPSPVEAESGTEELPADKAVHTKDAEASWAFFFELPNWAAGSFPSGIK